MKKMLIVMCMVGLVASGAMAYPSPNSMGVYMDAEATGLMDVCTDVGQFITQDLYLLIAGPTGSQVSAWEGQVEIVTTVNFFGAWEVLGGGINVGSGIDYIVGHGAAPLQPNSVGNIVLMHIALTVADTSAPIEIFIRRLPDSLSYPDGPGYAPEVGVLVPCFTSTGGPLVPVFVVNPTDGICIPRGNEDLTWGSVKSLYN